MPVATPVTDARVEAARQRRVGAARGREVRIQWFIEEVSNKVSLTMRNRMGIVTQMLKDRVVRNISTPVTKSTGPRGGRVVTNRSKPGEFPHAETTQLMKTVFSEVKQIRSGVYDGYIGTPLDYGLILEIRMDRKFLVASLFESLPDIRRILTGPIT